ncbi:LOW QUALITY PROTEIN: acetyl xylan esterase, partial [Micromonospora sp. M42]
MVRVRRAGGRVVPLTDLDLAGCLAYRPELDVPADLDGFWARTLDGGGDPAAAVYEPVDTGLTQIRTYAATIPGFGGEPVRGWLHLPANADRPLPCVVEYLGYGRGRGLPHEKLFWAAAGFAHLIMDSRGQGWSAATGGTPDPHPYPAGTVPGFLTRGVADPAEHYYRRLITDAVRFAEAARRHPAVDPARVAVTGFSQGGGSPWPSARCARTSPPSCRTCRSCATSAGACASPARTARTPRSSSTSRCTAIAPTRCSAPCPTWTPQCSRRAPPRRRCSPSPCVIRSARRRPASPPTTATAATRTCGCTSSTTTRAARPRTSANSSPGCAGSWAA